MKLTNLWKLYRMGSNWDIIDGKLSIPDSDLSLLDIREGSYQLKDDYNPKSNNPRGMFMPDMTDEDFQKWQNQKSGWEKFYQKVRGHVD